MLIRKNDTTVEMTMDGYYIELRFLPENNDKIIEHIKTILTNTFSGIVCDNKK